jgi:hypothetical protein
MKSQFKVTASYFDIIIWVNYNYPTHKNGSSDNYDSDPVYYFLIINKNLRNKIGSVVLRKSSMFSIAFSVSFCSFFIILIALYLVSEPFSIVLELNSAWMRLITRLRCYLAISKFGKIVKISTNSYFVKSEASILIFNSSSHLNYAVA